MTVDRVSLRRKVACINLLAERIVEKVENSFVLARCQRKGRVNDFEEISPIESECSLHDGGFDRIVSSHGVQVEYSHSVMPVFTMMRMSAYDQTASLILSGKRGEKHFDRDEGAKTLLLKIV